MKLFTKPILEKLKKNHFTTLAAKGISVDHKPVIKIFNPYGTGTWLFTEMDPDEMLFGLADIHCVELGYTARRDIESRVFRGLGLERDMHFVANKTLSQYTKESKALGRISV